MYLEDFIRELGGRGADEDKVYLSVYACGKSHEEPLTTERLWFAEGKVIIDAEDN